MHILILIAIERVSPRCQSQVNHNLSFDLQGILPVVVLSVCLSVRRWIWHTTSSILGMAYTMRGMLVVGLASGVS
jgi:hypothetical protein